jgi:hypothetical protein
VIVGHSNAAGSSYRAWRWTRETGMVNLGALPGATISFAAAVSGDGAAVVGNSVFPTGSPRAFLWTSALGVVDLNDYLPTLGIDLSGWVLTNATGASADGGTIVGTGIHNGATEGWVAVLRAACAANCDGSTAAPILNINDFICFQAAFAAGESGANCDHSTAAPVLNINDLICFQALFAAGCP